MKIIPVTKVQFNKTEQAMLAEYLRVKVPHHIDILVIQAEYEMFDHCIRIPSTDGNAFYFQIEDIMDFMIHGKIS